MRYSAALLRGYSFQKNKKTVQGEGNSAEYNYQKKLAIEKKLIRRIIEIRAGAYYYHRSINDWLDGSIPRSGSPDVFGVISTDGIQWGSAADLPTAPFYKYPGVSNMFVPCGYLGVGFIRQLDRTNKADCETYKIKGKRNFLNMFADIIAGYPIIEDYKGIDGIKHDVSGKGAVGYERNYVGWRVGVEYFAGIKQAFNVKLVYIQKTRIKKNDKRLFYHRIVARNFFKQVCL